MTQYSNIPGWRMIAKHVSVLMDKDHDWWITQKSGQEKIKLIKKLIKNQGSGQPSEMMFIH